MNRISSLVVFFLITLGVIAMFENIVRANEKHINFKLSSKPLLSYLKALDDPRKEAILKFHNEYRHKINFAKGSTSKHQAWEGGYGDHVTEIFMITEVLYRSLNAVRPLPFTLASAQIVGYFHDLEKMWEYTDGTKIDKEDWFNRILPGIDITFSEEELNALKYTHGESDAEYDPLIRKMGPLASLCHAADNISARLWHEERRDAKNLGSF